MVARILLSFSLMFSMLLTTFAQQPTPSTPKQTQPQEKPPDVDSQDVVRITTNLVQIDAVVTKDGKAIADLQPEDFEILEDGKPRAITNFSYISNIPGTPPISSATANPAARDRTAPPIPPAKINLGDQRRVVALVVDDLGISRESMSQVRKDVQKFVDEASPNDLVAIIRTGGDVGTLQQFTNDKRVLQAAVDGVRWNPCSRAGLAVFARVGQMEQAFNSGGCSVGVLNSTLHVLRFIVQGMNAIPGRKSLIFMSDHLPVRDDQPSVTDETKAVLGSVKSNTVDLLNPGAAEASEILNHADPLKQIAEFANRASVVIYAVDTRGLEFTGMTAADNVRLSSSTVNSNPQSAIMRTRDAQMRIGNHGSELIAERTGGFLIKDSNNFNLQKIMNDQQGYYLIGFNPAEETFDRKFHQLKLRLKRGGFTVRTREGFYGFSDPAARRAPLTPADEMNKALGSPFAAHDVEVRLTSLFMDDPKQGAIVRSFVYLNARDLTFKEADGWYSARLVVKAVAFGDNGRIAATRDQAGDLKFRGTDFDRAKREGIVYSFDSPLPGRGAFQFRVAVRDASTGKLGSAGQFVEIPDLKNRGLALSGIVARQVVNGNQTSESVATGPALRQFNQGMMAAFGFVVYNGNAAAVAGQLASQMRLIREGKVVFSGPVTPLDFTGQTDPQRLTQVMKIELGKDLTPGDYVCQIIVNGRNKQGPQVATQWIDFEIVK